MNSKSHSNVPHIIGFILGLVLTFAAVWIVDNDSLTSSVKWLILIIFAIIQAGLQLFMFMHMTEGEDRDAKIVHTGYGIFMALVIVLGSIWVMTSGHATM